MARYSVRSGTLLKVMHRIRLHTAAGAFATLLAMIPWKVLQASGMAEERAASIAGALLAVTAVVAFAARNTPFAQKSFFVPAYREAFEVRAFLRSFAAYAFTMLALAIGLWIYWANAQP